MLLVLRKHDIIPPMVWNLRLGDLGSINKFNDTLQTIFVEHDIYQKIHYICNQAIYPLLSHPSWAFEILDEIITGLIYSADKKFRTKNNRSYEMVTEIQESDGFIRTLGAVKDSI